MIGFSFDKNCDGWLCTAGSLLGRFAMVLVLMAWFVGPARAQQEPVTAETPLITGTDVSVTVADYRNALSVLPPKMQRGIEGDPVRLREFLFELYTERKLAQEAEKLKLDQQPLVQAELAQARRKILVDAIVREKKEARKQPDFTALAEEYYQTHQKNYAQPERIRVAHILWSMKCDCEDMDGAKHAQAEAVLKELRAGADFAKLASQYSDDKKSAQKGGDLGDWVTRGKLVKPFEEAAFALAEPGAISGVVKTQYGYHIIKLIAREPAGVKPFEQVKPHIIEELSNKYQVAAHKAFVGQNYPTAKQFSNAAIDALSAAR